MINFEKMSFRFESIEYLPEINWDDLIYLSDNVFLGVDPIDMLSGYTEIPSEWFGVSPLITNDYTTQPFTWTTTTVGYNPYSTKTICNDIGITVSGSTFLDNNPLYNFC
jgi:hypothetical protein